MKQVSVFLVGVGLLMFSGACKQAFFAETGATLEIRTEKTNIDFNESVTVFISGNNADGSLLWDGTRVDLTVVNGTLSAYSVEVEDGEARITATGNVERGEMRIGARSGNITAPELSLNVGTHPEVADIVILANPQFLPAGGGASTITVYLYDEYYQPIPNRAVLISAPQGAMASQGLPVETNASGAAYDVLTTLQGTWVTAKSGGQEAKVYVFVGGE